MQRSDIPPGVWPASHDYDGFRYLEVGWGEDDGYRKPLSVRTAFRALRGSMKTVLLCDGFNQPENRGRAVVEVDLSQRGFDRLCQHIAQTYALDKFGRPILLEKDWYRGRGRYSGFHNCNTWVAAGLRAAGCPINPTISITPRPLLLQIRQFGRDFSKNQEGARKKHQSVKPSRFGASAEAVTPPIFFASSLRRSSRCFRRALWVEVAG